MWGEKKVKTDFPQNIQIVIESFKKECKKLGFEFKPEAEIFSNKLK